jgi:hypothetical protein
MSEQERETATKVTRKPTSRPKLGRQRRRAARQTTNFDETSEDGFLSHDMDSALDDIARIVGL